MFWLSALAGFGFGGWSLWTAARRPAAAAAPSAPPAQAGPPATPAPIAGVTPAPAPEVIATWVEPVDGTCPLSHPVKANDNSGIFHVPGGRFYDRTKAERCYATPDAATSDGYRAAKS